MALDVSMAAVYASLVAAGAKTLDQVPARLRVRVEALIAERGDKPLN